MADNQMSAKTHTENYRVRTPVQGANSQEQMQTCDTNASDGRVGLFSGEKPQSNQKISKALGILSIKSSDTDPVSSGRHHRMQSIGSNRDVLKSPDFIHLPVSTF